MNLPELLGCETPTAKPVETFRIGDDQIAIHRCPRALLDADLLDVIDRAATGYLKRLSPAEVRRLPAGLVAAVEWCEHLLEGRKADG